MNMNMKEKMNRITSRHVFLAVAALALIAGGWLYGFGGIGGYSQQARVIDVSPAHKVSADHVGSEQGFGPCASGWKFPKEGQNPMTGNYYSVPQPNTPGQKIISVRSLYVITQANEQQNLRLPASEAAQFHHNEIVVVTCRGGKISVSHDPHPPGSN